MNIHKENKEHIRSAFNEIQTKDDLLNLLNYTKILVYGEKTIPFKLKHLNYHSNPKSEKGRYTQFKIRKKSGGERIINSPSRGLKAIQKCLNLVFQTIYEVHPSANGFVPKRSIVDNAKVHTGRLYVYNIDLKDFFPSIDQARIWGRLQHPPFNLNIKSNRLELANIIASLCCHSMEVERLDDKGQWQTVVRNVLPQGAPTSPVLSNIICQQLDFYLNAASKRFGLKYSRYADDLTFSSMHNEFQSDGEFLKEIHRLIANQNFFIKEAKTRLQKQGYRQEVTGLLVNEKVNVQKRYIKQLRMWLYYWENYGYERANAYFLPQYLVAKGSVKKGQPNMANVIAGKLEYLKMVKGVENDMFLKLANRFKALTQKTEIEKISDSLSIGTDSIDEINLDEKLQINIKSVLKPTQISKLKKRIILNEGQSIPYLKIIDNKEDISTYDPINLPILHKPQELVSILKSFSINNSALKYSTHSWEDGKDAGLFEGLEDFLVKVRHEFSKISGPLKNLNYRFYSKIISFLLNPDVGKDGWGMHRVKIGWSSPELFENWQKEIEINPNKKPEDIIIPERVQFQLKTSRGVESIQKFKQIIDLFKNEIEIRDESPVLEDLILDYNDKLLKGFIIKDSSNLENFKNKTFYTDVDYLKKALGLVFENIQKRPQHREVSYSIIDNKNSLTLVILQYNSFNKGKSIYEEKLSLKKGDFSTIKDKLINLCDWSIESEFLEGLYRINFLASDPSTKHIEKLDSVEGFKYLFTFYK